MKHLYLYAFLAVAQYGSFSGAAEMHRQRGTCHQQPAKVQAVQEAVLKIAFKDKRPEDILGLLSKGMGIALLIRRQAKFYRNSGIVGIELIPAISSRISLIGEKSAALPPAARMFFDFIPERRTSWTMAPSSGR